jgi:hypothetical protein
MVPVRVVWSKYQGPAGELTYGRPGSPSQETTTGDSGPGAEVISLPDARGTARVLATFHAPGEYVMRAQADNWTGPDSTSGDQCCWSNAYVRVRVSQ